VSVPLRVERGDVPDATAAALRDGAIVAEAPVAVLDLEGSGAVSALQGLLTQDVEKAGEGGFVYGALLTPKGMVVVEGWAARATRRVTYTVPLPVRDRVIDLWSRYVPPRLAKRVDRTGTVAVLRLAGPQAMSIAAAAGLPAPDAHGRAAIASVYDVALELARPPAAGAPPFALQVIAPRASAEGLVRRLVGAGAVAANAAALELARILAGWPSVLAEVDDKTLPQEIRFDELGGVSYTKGCYTGQETVSRLHFRGHANRVLRGLVFDDEPATERGTVEYQDRDAGRVTSIAWVPPATDGRWIGLGVLRREVTPGAMVRAGGTDARVADLPFAPWGDVPA
jgi:folate-binding protein YgfZ